MNIFAEAKSGLYDGRSQKPRFIPWKRKLQDLIDANNHLAMQKGRVVSGNTMADRAKIIFQVFNQLHHHGYRLEEPKNLKPKHIEFLIRLWCDEQELDPSTLKKRISILRTLCMWIGKPGMVRDPAKVVDHPERLKRTYAAQYDKSWSAMGVDVGKLLNDIMQYDEHTGHQLLVIRTFGLRRKEGVMIKPRRADKGDYLLVSDGTKGSRDRVCPIDTPEKRAVVDQLKTFVGKGINQHLGLKGNSLKQELAHFDYVMRRFGITKKKLGVTAHGLRHEYLNNRYEEIAGHPSPVRGGVVVDPEQDERARYITAEEAGHARLNITTAYYGSSRRKVTGSRQS